MLSLMSKRELAVVLGPRYRTATRGEKSRILDEFVAVTGYVRKYAIQVLNQPVAPLPTRRRRRRLCQYDSLVKAALVAVWSVADHACGKRLVPGLPTLVDALERHAELTLAAETKSRLLSLSPATADRLLADERRQVKQRGLATTKPGTLLKSQITVRTWAEWDDARPGFLEVDLVAHCDDSTGGEFLYSLVLTDIATGWTECEALLNRSQKAVTAAIDQVRRRLPFPILGIDSDNGSEFINADLLRYCRDHKITFTRSRPYKKNDQAHVEQKNWSIVRRHVGYDRFAGREAQAALTALYSVLRLYVNCFLPTLKLKDKQRVDGKVRKTYHTATTPYQRLLDAKVLSDDDRRELEAMYLALNPAALKRRLEQHQQSLWQYATVRYLTEAT
jgi:transposase InsO family protein